MKLIDLLDIIEKLDLNDETKVELVDIETGLEWEPEYAEKRGGNTVYIG